jgi:succinoglycan biosynthesis protein ExoM
MAALISVCVCTYRRPQSLQRTLESVACQRLPDDLSCEVVVVDNDAAATSQATVDRFAASAKIAIRYAVEPRKGLSAARNRALDLASGDWLALIDDDEAAADDWLVELHRCAREFGADAVIGGVRPEFETPPPPWIASNGSFDLWLPPTGTNVDAGDALTGNTFLRAEFLRANALRFDPAFNETGGEDTDFFRRLLDHGGLVVSAREAVVHERIPRERATPAYLARRAVRQGEIHARITHRHGGTRALATDMARASVNIGVAAMITAASLPLGKAVYHRYYLLLVRNLGKFRYYLGLPPIAMYR